jgi:hypothetical protein
MSISKTVITLMTMMSTATPSMTPTMEINVITETNVLLGRRYLSASSNSKGKRDIGGESSKRQYACQ